MEWLSRKNHASHLDKICEDPSIFEFNRFIRIYLNLVTKDSGR